NKRLVDILRVDRNDLSEERMGRGAEALVQAPIGANYLVRKSLFIDISRSLKGLINWCQFEAFIGLWCAKMMVPVVCDHHIIIEHVATLSGAKGESHHWELIFN